MLNFDDSIRHMKVNYRTEYPVNQSDRATFGNIPQRLHTEITAMSKETGMQLPMVLAALLDFAMQYEDKNKEALVADRKANKGRRG